VILALETSPFCLQFYFPQAPIGLCQPTTFVINIGYHYQHLVDRMLEQLDGNIEECAIE
jgi:hypothetical protein